MTPLSGLPLRRAAIGKIAFTCLQCGLDTSAYLSQSDLMFCSRKCQGIASRKHEPVDFNGKRYLWSSSRKYYHAKKGGQQLHRDVWEYHNGSIPEKFHIHHIDHDPKNNSLENLQLISASEHATLHNLARSRARAIVAAKGGK